MKSNRERNEELMQVVRWRTEYAAQRRHNLRRVIHTEQANSLYYEERRLASLQLVELDEDRAHFYRDALALVREEKRQLRYNPQRSGA
jgi:hypothetical protein